MLNEIKGSSTVVDRAISGQGLSGTWQESPLVGTDALMKAHQSGSPKKFRLTERPFLELVNVRGDTRNPAFVKAVQNVIGCTPPDQPNNAFLPRYLPLLQADPAILHQHGQVSQLLRGIESK